MAEIQTKVIDNFGGRLTRIINGDMNSGLAKYDTSFGYQPFNKPNNLNYYETPTRLDSAGSVVTDTILKFKERVESGTAYVYAYGYNGQFYKVTISSDSPTLVVSLTNTATMKYGGGMAFYTGVTEKVWLGHDTGLLKMAFDGSGQTPITSGVTWVNNVPRPIMEFLGKIYIGNDTNIVEVDSTELVTSGAKLSPSVPANTHIVDIKITPDGRYLAMLCNRNTPLDVQTVDPTDFSTNQESAIYYWNGTDAGITTFESTPSFQMTTINNSSPYTYRFGYDVNGAVLRNETDKILTLNGCKSPMPGATDWSGNQVFWGTAENINGSLRASVFSFGSFDAEVPVGLWRNLRATATGTNSDVMIVGAMKIVSNLSYKSGTSVPNTLGRIYYSTYETGGTAAGKLYKFLLTPTGTATALAGVYETQTEQFPQRVFVRSVRLYTEPTVSNSGIQTDLISSDGNVLSGSSNTYSFASGTDTSQAQGALEKIEFQGLRVKPTFSMGLRLTNTGTGTIVVHKAEIDYDYGGR